MSESRRTMARRSSDSPSLSSPRPARTKPPGPDFSREAAWHQGGGGRIAGVDEAGRGPLAGPVVAAAVVLRPDRIPAGLDDSKKLGARQREELFEAILADAEVGIGTASAAEIDHVNIRQATFLAMRRAISALANEPNHVLVDGRDIPTGCLVAATALIGGDALCLSIAAASIVAKVTRDRIMTELCTCDPRYGFRQHMGYPTAAHVEALKVHGPGPHHRRTFGPVRALL
ncbi:ribonuclease HII [Aureimonas sp. N4]|uniref:ribonuclease HII n=1 Tax=Aureimonas sp. N4 TaxID=1638165 RepID=UPI0009EB7C3C|nr:ribonuclease HII [Aureimonas sp. N4]